MGPLRVGLVVVALLAAIAAGVYWWRESHPPRLPPPASSTSAPAAPALVAKPPRYVIDASPDAPKPLPRLNESDPTLVEALSGLLGSQAFARLFAPRELVRHIVATIDNLPRETYAARLNPVRPPGGLMRTTGTDSTLSIAPDNAARYTPYVSVAQGVDSAKLVALYVRLYPLFQQAYVELGFPDGYFNDRLIEVIDHLLASPEVHGPLGLTVPHVLYEYADPELEARSAGRKLLMRMGSENAAKVKAKLRDIRREVIAASKKEGALK
jgi:hypothetical protein